MTGTRPQIDAGGEGPTCSPGISPGLLLSSYPIVLFTGRACDGDVAVDLPTTIATQWGHRQVSDHSQSRADLRAGHAPYARTVVA